MLPQDKISITISLSTSKKLPIGVKLMGQKYQARLNIKKRTIHLGTYDTPELAQKAYNSALLNI